MAQVDISIYIPETGKPCLFLCVFQFAQLIVPYPVLIRCLFIRNETNSKNRKREKPCRTSIFAKRKRLIVSDTLVSKLSTLFGGGEGNRTPVRKQLGKNFSGRSLLFTFPHPGGNKHPTGISSFMMHGMGKAYHTHVLHSDHTRARLVDLPGRMGA